MAIFTWNPAWGTSLDKKPKILKAQFGDGYSQRTKDGINNNPGVWNLSLDEKTDVEADAIMAFLDARGGAEAFYWTPPSSSTQVVVTCENCRRSWKAFNSNTINATFIQQFDASP